MKHLKITYLLISTCIVVNLSSCQKYLDKKPTTDLVVPQTLNDFTRLMDDYQLMNASPILGEVSSDNYYFADRSAWESQPIHQRNAYIFKPDFEEGTNVIADWSYPYKQVFVANVVLDGLTNITRNETNANDWDFVKGWALFMRSYAFFNLAQLFSPAYDPSTANTDLGIPLRLLPGVDEHYQRASLEETYQQILKDMNLAIQLLPQGLPAKNRNRPSKEAAYGAMARIYLAMREYGLALENADQCLALYDQLLTFNDLANQSSPFILDLNHKECLWASILGEIDLIFFKDISLGTLIDTTLYDQYADDDFRKIFFFKPSVAYPGKANVNWAFGTGSFPFGGIAVDEVYLIKSECLIRNSQIPEGIDLLNRLLATRYADNTYHPYITTNYNEALTAVLTERRKELVFRGLRWQDIRRLNKEGQNITITHKLESTVYELPPNSNLFTLPIPSEEIRLNKLIQNPRN